ncbi:MAG: ABC transporter ATP-binding protein [Chloroflexi bacterium]|nr:ABC transporter ATP-binding protein [Chloroflexota bacterium]
MAIIRTVKLTKHYRDLVAVDEADLEVEENECFGLLGPNGAGKTTLIRMITGVSPPTRGEIWINNISLLAEPRRVKALLGVVPQKENLDPDLNVFQNLLTFTRYFDIPDREARRRSAEILDFFELREKRHNSIRELSGGMKRRLLLARGLINQPKILVLDEPSVGLDPQGKYQVWQKLKDLRAQGVTQLLSTQNMEEAALLCNRVAIINLGKILVIDRPRELVSRFIGERTWEIETNSHDRTEIIAELRELKVDFQEAGGTIKLFNISDAVKDRFPVTSRQANLEDVFFKLTGRSLTE